MPRRSDSASPTTVFPLPATPMSTTARDAVDWPGRGGGVASSRMRALVEVQSVPVIARIWLFKATQRHHMGAHKTPEEKLNGQARAVLLHQPRWLCRGTQP